MIDAMAHEARVGADPNLRADRFVERWQGLHQQRGAALRAGDHEGSAKAGKALQGLAKSLERDPQVESVLRGRERELGLEKEIGRDRSMAAALTRPLEIGRDRGLSRDGEDMDDEQYRDGAGAGSTPEARFQRRP